MRYISLAIAAIGLAAACEATAAVKSTENTASLAFVSENQVLVGTAYGLDAVDSRPRLFGERVAAHLAPGERTVWYSCPGSRDSSALTFNFKAGQRYQLVCQVGKDAVIRKADEC